jgi:type IV pilus assembly protein PilA
MNKHFKKENQQGFSLIELIVAIGILGVLLALVLVALNPARQFAQANNTKRASDITTLLNAIHQFMADNKGIPPTGIASTVQTIASGAGNSDLCSQLVSQYVAALPQDPASNGGNKITNCSSYNTYYTVIQSVSDNRITLKAPRAELNATITITR